MNRSLVVLGILVAVFLVIFSAGCNGRAVLTGSDIREMIQPVPGGAIFEETDYKVWGGSMTRTDDGTCHLLYSRIDQGWLETSVIAYATADHPLGPYKFKEVVLPGRGGDYWDAQMTHNPTIKKFGDKYYLYHIGTKMGDSYEDYGDKGRTRERVNLRVHQRIGVAVADHPSGPWKRFDKPIIDVEPGTIRHFFVTNPSVVRRKDGTFLMVYKCMRTDGKTVHGIATADDPLGPFKCLPQAIFTAKDDKFAAEDPYIWSQDGHFYGILKDFKGHFTGHRFALTLFESADGIEWNLAEEPLISAKVLNWDDGTVQKFKRLQRPQLWFEDGKPAVLFCAAVIDSGGSQDCVDADPQHQDDCNRTFNIHIPLKKFK